jgi:HAD superfamily hydrolase (TIGR01549 family)
MKENRLKINISALIPEIEAIIFDLDGTLYDKQKFVIRLIFNNIKYLFLFRNERRTRKLFRGTQFPTPELYIAQFFNSFSSQFKSKKYSPAFLKKWYYEQYMSAFIQILQRHYTARPEVEGIFEWLHERNIKFAVLSEYPCVAERMCAIGLDPAFNGKIEIPCYSCEDFGSLKPNKIPFLEVAKRLDVAPEKVLVIGDKDETDGRGAKNAGMWFLKIE